MEKYQNSYDKAPKKKTSAPAPSAPPAPRAEKAPAPQPPRAAAAAAPAPAAEPEQEYQYLYTRIPEEVKAGMKALSPAERKGRMAALDDAWKNHRSRLAGALAEGKRALKEKKKEGALNALRKALPDALYSIQCRAWLQMVQGEKPGLDSFLGCLSPLAQGIREAGDKAQEALPSEEFRKFLGDEKSCREVQGASAVKFFLYPALLFALWFGLIKLFSAPFMAPILAHQFWEYITYVFAVILCLGVIVLLVGALGMNFFLSIFVGPLVCGTLLWLVGMGFELIIKLFPAAVRANFEEVSIFGKLFFGPLWLILFLASAGFLVYSLLYHGDAFGKTGRLKKMRRSLREALPVVKEERWLYGLLLETADYCEAAIRWEEGAARLNDFTKDEAIAVTDGVRQLLQGLCERYDNAVKAVAAMEE